MNNSDIYKIIRKWLIELLPEISPENIFSGFSNDVPLPSKSPFVVLHIKDVLRHATNETWYDRESKQMSTMPTQVTMQIDVYGNSALEYITRICTVWFSGIVKLIGLAPLYHTNPMMIPLTNSEAQYEMRWSTDLKMQINPVTVTDMEFADVVDFTTIELTNEE